MEKTILKIGWDVDRSIAMVFIGRLMKMMEDSTVRPKPDFPVVFEMADVLRAVYKQSRAGTHIYTITTINRTIN